MALAQANRGFVTSRKTCPSRVLVRASAQPLNGGAVHRQPPAQALIHTLSGVHKSSGRASSAVNVILGADNSEEAWRCIDQKVNSYPSLREFTAIGSGGSSFRQSMVSAVQAVVGPVECVTQRCSTGGRYVSVTVGPVLVSSADDVLEVYTRMKTDHRLRYFL